jgi:hypothetical protein
MPPLKGGEVYVPATGLRFGGRWSSSEAGKHINELQLLAIYHTLRACCRDCSNTHIKIIDSFTISWEGGNLYAFPPFCLIGRVVQKIIYEHARGILVVPDWTTKSWFTMVKKITVQKPPTLLVTDDVLCLHSSTLTRGSRSHPLAGILRLLLCKVRRDAYY